MSSAEPKMPSSAIVRLRKRWNGWSVVKPMPASTCWQWAATVRGGAARDRLGERGGDGVRVVARPRSGSRRAPRPRRARRRAGGGPPGSVRSGARTAPAPTACVRASASIARVAPAICCATARRPSATADSHAPAVERCRGAGVALARRTWWKRASGSMPSHRGAPRRTVVGTVSPPSAGARCAHTTRISRAVPAPGGREPVARARCRRRPPDRADPTLPNGGSSTARSARGFVAERGHDDVVERRSPRRSSRRARRTRCRSRRAARPRASRANRDRRARESIAPVVPSGAPRSRRATVDSSSARSAASIIRRLRDRAGAGR